VQPKIDSSLFLFSLRNLRLRLKLHVAPDQSLGDWPCISS
jgi:hypothetical protein